MIRELSRIVRNETFDEQPLSKLSSEDIDFRAASEQFDSIKQLTIKDLETLEILIGHQGKKVPTVAGVILFGKERAKLFPDAWIQAGRFKGTDKSLILDSTEFHSYPIHEIYGKRCKFGLNLGRRISWNNDIL